MGNLNQRQKKDNPAQKDGQQEHGPKDLHNPVQHAVMNERLYDNLHAGGNQEQQRPRANDHVPDPIQPQNDIIHDNAETANQKDQMFALVIAIDFGTTYSGYAYAHVDPDPEIHLNPNWVSAGTNFQFKSPTCLCVNKKDGTFHSFGIDAQTDYIEAEYGKGLVLFDNFKMELFDRKNITKNTEIKSRGGFTMKAIDVFALSLSFFKKHCIDKIEETYRLPSKEKILWVLTVPAIWTDKQKSFIRAAAVQAGLIDSEYDEQLMIALEQEAASVYCRSQYKELKDTEKHIMGVGDDFIIVDAGGGTVDITSYKCLPDGKSKEIAHPFGADYGGNKVNDQFLKFLRKTLEDDFIDHCQTKFPSALFQIQQSFEMAKQEMNSGESSELSIEIGMGFAECFQDFRKVSLLDYFNSNPQDGVRVAENGQVCLAPEIVKSLFDPVISDIIHLVLEHLSKPTMQKVKTIFLVGGFGQCSCLESRMKDVFINQDVIKPEDSVLSVIKGAVMCGLNPGLIQSRVSPRSYSILAVGSEKEDFLSLVIEKGKSVPHGHFEEKYCSPASTQNQNVILDLYASDGDFIKNPNDPANYKIGRVELVCSTADTNNCIVMFKFIFGGTEIKVEGIDCQSKKKVETSFTIDYN